MASGTGLDVAHRYVAWLRRRAGWVFAASALCLAASIYLILFHLPLYADFAALLPPDAPAVRDLHRLEARVQDRDSALVLVDAPDPKTCAAAAGALAGKLRALPASLITRVDDDDAPTRAFIKAHQHLFVPLADLQAARDALKAKIAEANPLYIDLGDSDDAAATPSLDDLRARRRQAMAQLDRSGYVSADGKLHLLVVRTNFEKTDVASGKRLMRGLRADAAQVERAYPGVRVGLTGGVVSTVAEHTALFNGIVLSSIVTAVLVGLVLALYFRSGVLLAVLTFALVVSTLTAFGIAALTVGHLNAATAFLGAIIAGNGVNYGILLIARYLEERRRFEAETSLAIAIHGTLRPTLVASLGASIAYGSLAATSFRGFADFAAIGAVGMLLCWIGSYTLLPALVLHLVPRPRVNDKYPIIGRVLARLLGFRRPSRVVGVAVVVAGLAGWITYRYIANDPFEYDITQLRSEGRDARMARYWMARSDAAFGRGITGETYIAVDSLDDVDRVIAALARADRPTRAATIGDVIQAVVHGEPPDRRPTIGKVRSIRDVMPTDQPAKLAVLKEIRDLLDNDALQALDDDERAELAALRPPDDLAEITPATLPPDLAERLRERDGRVGLILAVRPALSLDEWNGRDLVRFADAVRRLDVGGGRTVTTSGASVVFADILDAIEHDGPRVTLVAAIGLTLMVLIVVGRDRRAASVLAATVMGALGLVAACALLGLKVNFLDFIALPITLGLGIDYAINIAHRHHGEHQDARATLRSSGSAVFVCSLTTIIGYGSLLVSENLAIRGFGTASLVGEVTCLSSALIIVPAIISLRGRRAAPAAPAAPAAVAA
ncbi:MAG TPA: MMPL family transporter [Kofleriaceae bacterium]|nr:MMPL family transporter [Kofleriaceae bacterium]